MKDFTLDTYRELLEALQRKGYELITYADYRKSKINNRQSKFVILRHDVDAKPANSLKTAQSMRLARKQVITSVVAKKAINRRLFVPSWL